MFDDPHDPPRAVPGDPNDDYLVALAIDSGGTYLATRDKHFEGVRVEGVRIVTPGRLIRLLR
jgi:predicted nucleic acid-binding protein